MAEGLDISPSRSGLSARCLGCRNRFGLVNLVVLDSGMLCCRRCWKNRDLLELPDYRVTVEVVG
jgi:hypothetical protein